MAESLKALNSIWSKLTPSERQNLQDRLSPPNIDFNPKMGRRKFMSGAGEVGAAIGGSLVFGGMAGGFAAMAVAPAPGSGGTDIKVKIDASDTTADFLNPKLLVTTKLTKTIQNPGANENLLLDVAAQQFMTIVFVAPGVQSITGKIAALNLYAPTALTILEVHIELDTAPTGASFIVDVKKNGTTIFTTAANKPTIAAGSNSATSGTPDITSLAKNDILTADVNQVGSTVPGTNLIVQVRCKGVLTT